jgi:cell division protease FtsH
VEIQPGNAPPEELDELDKKIDNFLSTLGGILRFLLTIAAIAAFVYYILIPHLEEWGPGLMMVGYLIFQLFFAIMFMIVQFVALFWFIGRPRIYWVMPGETGVSFKDYKGNPEVLEAAKQVVTLLRGAKEFKAMGGEAIRGLLLVGNPGTGKSYLGQCIATEAGVPFGYMSAPSIQGMFWGMDTMRVMALYGKARKLAQKFGACILFIDEIDAIGRSRGGMSNGMPGGMMGGMMGGNGGGALNELLNQMDPLPRDSWKTRLLRKFGLRRGKADMKPVLTMAATNIAEVLDAALLRPGRFDRKISVDLPDADGRREIIEYYLTRIQHDLKNHIERMVGDTIHYTPVAIKYVINESVVVAHWDQRDMVTYKDWSRALENHEMGLRQPIRSMSREWKRRLAYHEVGHALAMIKYMPSERLHKVSIIRHGSALGITAWKPSEESYNWSKDEYLAHIRVSLGSRAAEQLFLGMELDGAAHDLQTATQLADAVVRHYGMNGSLYQPRALGQALPDQMATWQIEELLDEQFKIVKQMLEDEKDYVNAIVEELIEALDLSGDDVEAIMQKVTDARRANGVNGTDGHGVEEEVYGLPGIFSIVRKKDPSTKLMDERLRQRREAAFRQTQPPEAPVAQPELPKEGM